LDADAVKEPTATEAPIATAGLTAIPRIGSSPALPRRTPAAVPAITPVKAGRRSISRVEDIDMYIYHLKKIKK
jgi:hypothetical protein